jgi:hypothetical protein
MLSIMSGYLAAGASFFAAHLSFEFFVGCNKCKSTAAVVHM